MKNLLYFDLFVSCVFWPDWLLLGNNLESLSPSFSAGQSWEAPSVLFSFIVYFGVIIYRIHYIYGKTPVVSSDTSSVFHVWQQFFSSPQGEQIFLLTFKKTHLFLENKTKTIMQHPSLLTLSSNSLWSFLSLA